jgi:hypothetical protein
MSLLSDPSTLRKTPTCLAIGKIDTQGFAASRPSSALDVLRFAGSTRPITRECFEAPLSIISPEQYTAALVREVQTTAKVGKAYIYCPAPFIAKLVESMLSRFELAGKPASDLGRVVTTVDALRATIAGTRSWILDGSRHTQGLESYRHFGGNPIYKIDRRTYAVDLLSKLEQVRTLRNLGEASEIRSGSRLEFIQSSAEHTNGSCTIDSALIDQVAIAFNSDRIELGEDLTRPKLGFFVSYRAEDFAHMLHKPGCRINILRLQNAVLGYSVSYLSPVAIPLHGQRLAAALEAYNLLPEGAIGTTVGFVDLIHDTADGRRIGQILGIRPSEILHQQLAEDARVAGITHLVGQTRAFPHPNTMALRSHSAHGWRDSGVTLLYPTKEDSSGWSYCLGRAIILNVNQKASVA